jgi:hypothetical protein
MNDADFERDLNEQRQGPDFDISAELQKSYIDPTIEIPEPPVILAIDGLPVFTAGSISTLIGKAKSRKTFFVTGMISAIASGTWGNVTGRRTDRAILWFDTEMSKYHATLMVKRCIRLTGGKGSVLAYGLRPYTPAQRMAMIEHAIYNTPGVGFVAIDGLRDLLTRGINDEEEATTVTSKLMKWTSELDLHINLILHQNKNDLNARGHIGTECINKSEAVISVTKSKEAPDVSEVSAEYSRNIDFQPFTFTINDTGLPEYLGEVVEHRPKSRPSEFTAEQHAEILNKVFSKTAAHNYGELWKSIKLAFDSKYVTIGTNF